MNTYFKVFSIKILPFLINPAFTYFLSLYVNENELADFWTKLAIINLICLPIAFSLFNLTIKEMGNSSNQEPLFSLPFKIFLLSSLTFIVLFAFKIVEIEIYLYLLLVLTYLINAILSGYLRFKERIYTSQLLNLFSKLLFIIIIYTIIEFSIFAIRNNLLIAVLLFSNLLFIIAMYFSSNSLGFKINFKSREGYDIKKILLVSAQPLAVIFYAEAFILFISLYGKNIDVVNFKIIIVSASMLGAPLAFVNFLYNKSISKNKYNYSKLKDIYFKSRVISISGFLAIYTLIYGISDTFYNGFDKIVFTIISIGFLYSCFVGPTGIFMIMTDQEKISSKITIISIFLSVLLFYFFLQIMHMDILMSSAFAITFARTYTNYKFFKYFKHHMKSLNVN
jgi:hypothetical protein